MKKYNKEDMLNMSRKEQQKLYKELVPIANRRISDIEKRGLKKQSILSTLGKRGKFNKKYSKRDFNKLARFMSAETSTVSGIKRAEKNRTAALRALGLDDTLLHEKDFYTFLNSQEYKALSSRNPSEDVIEIYDLMYKQGKTHEEIQEELRDYIAHDKPVGVEL